MGNCIVFIEPPIYDCGICRLELGMHYIFCPYCNNRFHTRCIIHLKSIYRGCPHCKKNYLRFIDKKLPRNKI